MTQDLNESNSMDEALFKLHPHQRQALEWLKNHPTSTVTLPGSGTDIPILLMDPNNPEREAELRKQLDAMRQLGEPFVVSIKDYPQHEPLLVDPKNAQLFEDEVIALGDRMKNGEEINTIPVDSCPTELHFEGHPDQMRPTVVIGGGRLPGRATLRSMALLEAFGTSLMGGPSFFDSLHPRDPFRAPKPPKEPPKQTDADRLALARAVAKRMAKVEKLKRGAK